METIYEKCNLCKLSLTKCICDSKWKYFDHIISKANYLNYTIDDNKKPTQLRVSVIPICFHNGSKINIEAVDLFCPRDFGIAVVPPKKRKSKKTTNKKEKFFFNQITLKFKCLGSNIAAKIFLNGGCQVAGCRDVKTTAQVSQYISCILRRCEGMLNEEHITAICDTNLFRIQNVKMSMINSTFKVPYSIFLRAILETLVEESKSVFDKYKEYRSTRSEIDLAIPLGEEGIVDGVKREKYVGMIGRFQSKLGEIVSIFFFKSGKIIITGAKHPQSTLDAYFSVNSYLRKYYNRVLL